jgi:hypothetical protein
VYMLFVLDAAGVPSVAKMVTLAGNSAPGVSLTAPANGASYAAPATVDIAASASDGDGRVAKVEFFNGSTKLGEDATAPYSFSWSGVAAGTYSITARATDDLGASTTSAARTITVTGANAAPAVGITAPGEGASFPWHPTITISASASDADGTVARVEFFRGGTTKLGEDTSAPYSYRWKNAPSGTHALTARATDDRGAATTSAAVNITVRARR